MQTNILPESNLPDSADKTKNYFNNYGKLPNEFISNQIEQVVAFFTSNGFSKESAEVIATIFLEESKKSNSSPLTYLDFLKTSQGVNLTNAVSLLINQYRGPTSKLGFISEIQIAESIKRNNAV